MTRNKEQAYAFCRTAGAWGQASEDRITGITSGRFREQQGLVATCKDSLHEAINRRTGELRGIGA